MSPGKKPPGWWRRLQTPEDTGFAQLSEPIRKAILHAGFRGTTPPQEEAIPFILKGENVLLVAPTGSGKTEAVLLPILDAFIRTRPQEGISILYVTPLRALNRDMLKRLLFWSQELGFRVEVRHGDTPQQERRRQSLKPPDFLVTTPETLQAILPGRRMRNNLKTVRWVIVDEIHELAQDRRGVQLTLGLERLRQVATEGFQIIGLSATVGSPEEIGRFLAGTERRIKTIVVPTPKETKYFVEMPYPTEEDHSLAQRLYTAPEAAARISRIAEAVDAHRSTLIFVNSRQNAEMLGSKFNLLRKDMAVHHGSLSREERIRIENDFKEGRLKGLICTSTLELGIDIGSVDHVLQYMSPRRVSDLIQRVGRSGHRLDRISEGLVIGVSTDDVLESVAAIQRARQGFLEPIQIHQNTLDVLAHQIAGCLMDSEGRVESSTVLQLARHAYPYRDLPEEAFRKVVEYMNKQGYLRVDGAALIRTRRTRNYYFENLSMIPDERRYPVIDLATQQSVGILGEEFMLFNARVGVNFIVRGRVWQIQKIGEDGRVYVIPVEDPTAAIPGWDGEMLPVPFDLAQHTGRLREEVARALNAGTVEAVVEGLRDWPCERFARRKAVEEIAEVRQMGAPVPAHDRIVLEGVGRYLVVHACFGETVNDTLGELFEELLLREGLVRFWWADGYRILLELTASTEDLALQTLRDRFFTLSDDALEGAFKSILYRHFPFGYYMKFIAQRFGALKRGIFMDGTALKELFLKFRLTPIFDETIREALQLHVDFDRVRELFRKVRLGEITVTTFPARDRPTPIAWHILNRYVEAPELLAPETFAKDNVERMKLAISNEYADLLCFACGRLHENMVVKELPEHPRCSACGGGLLGVLFWSSHFVKDALRRKLEHAKLGEDEEKALVRARRSADLVLSYGKRAVIAQCVYGVGPQTASKLLAKMHDSDEDFYRDLLEAKLKFITTRPFWDRS